MPFNRDQIRQQLAALAAEGVFIGTSSWKYPGWRGMFYNESRYVYRGKFAETRFERDCLQEYAEVFKTVCVVAAYYKFRDEKYLNGLVSPVPKDFQFALKVTLKRFSNLLRFGIHAGQPNQHFLDSDLFSRAFLKPCEPFRQDIRLILFEFSRFYPTDYEHGWDFVADLDRFLAAIPAGWPCAVEMRNKHWLPPDYFACLARHGVAHVFNSWEALPPVIEQMAIPGSETVPGLTAARFLLKPGRKYEAAVEAFQPYDRSQEINDEARAADRALIARGKALKKDLPGGKRTFIYVNNRLEGSALETIAAMLDCAAGDRP